MTKHQYYCKDCGTEREGLLDHPAVGIGGYSWSCPRCNGTVDSKEVEPAARKPMTEPVYQIAMAEGSASTAWIDVAKDVFDDAGMYPEYKRRALYARPEPARKPMAEEYINAVAKAKGLNRLEAHFFLEGIRFAEKHHSEGGDGDD